MIARSCSDGHGQPCTQAVKDVGDGRHGCTRNGKRTSN